jgi:hypothetical protein
MLTKMRELCEQEWCSQLVANHHETDGDSIAYMLRKEEVYAHIVNWTQTWAETPQGRAYWSNIDREWMTNH